MACVCALLGALGPIASAQNVSGSLEGTVFDPSDAAVPHAKVQLKEQGTGNTKQVVADDAGFFRFLALPAGTYSITASADGFKTETLTGIELAIAEMRYNKINLSVGSTSESVSVTAEATPVQTSSSEKSQLVDGEQLENVTLKGRDMFGYMSLLPGLLDTSATSRDVTSPNNLSSITINGQSSLNFTVDGITDMDTSGDATVHFEPNMDSVQEVKVLTSNYQAEFGRNSGGTIAVAIKNGTQHFHGSGWWNHRHEGFNANDFFRNENGQPRALYRYNVEGWSLGGPVYAPKVFPRSLKDKIFFFASQEYTGQLNSTATAIGVPAGTQYHTVVTPLEKGGNFSQSVNGSGQLIKILDPLNGQQFSGNIIPQSRFDPTGQAILAIQPAPNYTPAPGNVNYLQDNYFSSQSNAHPRRNDVARVDFNITSKLTAYARWVHDYDDTKNIPYVNYPWTTGSSACTAGCLVDHPNPGHGYAASATYTFSPTLVNDFTAGKSYNTWDWSSLEPSGIARSQFGSIPLLYNHTLAAAATCTECAALDLQQNYIPAVTFGSNPPTTVSYAIGMTGYYNSNDIWSYTDNLSKIWGKHTLKAGFYLEDTYKLQPPQGGNPYSGSISFASDANNPLNTGDGYANALLGYMDTYTEQSGRFIADYKIFTQEYYVQDNWRISKKVTLDYGVRFYGKSPLQDENHSSGLFNPALYSAANAPLIYAPGCKVTYTTTCPSASRVAVNPANGTQAPQTYIGDFIPGTGNIGNGMFTPGVNGAPLSFYHQKPVVAAPRFGFAWDVFGDGKTAIRGGVGLFFDTLTINNLGVTGAQGLPPIGSTATISYAAISSLVAGSGVNAPVSVNSPVGNYPWDKVWNGSLGIQRNIGYATVLDVSYVGNLGRDLPLQVNINPVPLGADFLASNISSVTGSPLTQSGSTVERLAYRGYQNINQLQFVGYNNYNGLQMTANHRMTRGLQFGVAYTWSHAMALTAVDPLVANNAARNYGPSSTDRRQVLAVNYTYQIPGLGNKVGSKFLGVFTDRWTLSGVTNASKGAPFTPACTSSTNADITGSASETPRCNVLGNGASPTVAGTQFNTANFALPAVGGIGNLGVNALTGPGFVNFDATMTKDFPLGNEKRRFRLAVQAYNVFNHSEVSTWGTAAAFNASGADTTASFGFPTANRPARILAFSLRFEF